MKLNQKLKEKFSHLEVSCLKLSEVQKDNETKRIDSEYFKKEYLEKMQTLFPISTKLENLMMSGYYGILPKSDDYLKKGLNLVRGKDVRDSSLEYSNLVKVPYDYFQKRYQIHKGDILFLVKGATIGYSDGVLLILDEPAEPMIFNGSVFKLQVKNINSAYLYVFMMTNYFTFQKIREITNNGIEYNSLPTIKNFKIPLLPMNFQLEIEKLVKDSHQALEQSKELYKEAQNILYIELRLNPDNPLQSILDFSPTPKEQDSKLTQKSLKQNLNISIRTLKESLGTSGRLDSEYYQSKYEQNEMVIKSHKYTKLGNLVQIIKSIEPGSEAYRNSGIAFMRVSNLSPFGLSSSEIYLDSKDFKKNELQTLYPKKDMILLSKDGSVGIACYVEKDLKCVVSSGILRLKIKEKSIVLPKYLSLVLNSITTTLQAQRDSGGSIISHWKIDKIKNVLIPLLDTKIQKNIESKIQQSLILREKSKILLEKAKMKVEEKIKQ